jgi:hypothetical protein
LHVGSNGKLQVVRYVLTDKYDGKLHKPHNKRTSTNPLFFPPKIEYSYFSFRATDFPFIVVATVGISCAKCGSSISDPVEVILLRLLWRPLPTRLWSRRLALKPPFGSYIPNASRRYHLYLGTSCLPIAYSIINSAY